MTHMSAKKYGNYLAARLKKSINNNLTPEQQAHRELQISKLMEHPDGYMKYLQTLTPEKQERVHQMASSLRTGLHTSAPLTCGGPDGCLFISHCPLTDRTDNGDVIWDLKDFPLYRPCVLERLYMQQKIIDYIQELQVDPEDPVEISIVNELASIDLYKNRALMILSSGDRSKQGQDFIREDTTGYTEQGGRLTTSVLHPAMEVMDKLEKRRERWLDKLLATRSSRADMRLRTGEAKEESKVLKELELVRKALETHRKTPLELPLDGAYGTEKVMVTHVQQTQQVQQAQVPVEQDVVDHSDEMRLGD